jgi:protein TonB
LEELVPNYPRSCRRRGHEGTVLLECSVDRSGSVVSVRIISSTGCVKLDQSALDAVRRARFQPARMAGKAVASTVILPVTFRLR